MKIKEITGKRVFQLKVSAKELMFIEEALNRTSDVGDESTYELWDDIRGFMQDNSVKTYEV